MLGHARAEGVGGQSVFTSEKLEIFRRGTKVKDSLLRADRTITFRQPVQIDPGAEPHPTAMTAALTRFEHRSYSLIRNSDGLRPERRLSAVRLRRGARSRHRAARR